MPEVEEQEAQGHRQGQEAQAHLRREEEAPLNVSEVLVTLECEGRTAGVIRLRDDERLWLTHDIETYAGSGIKSHTPIKSGTVGGGAVYGGVMPPGATAATVIDYSGAERAAAVGGGAWVAYLPEDPLPGERPVRYTADDGSIVAPPLPADWQRTPVTDTDAACPVCHESGWDEVVPAPDPDIVAPDGRPFQQMPFRVCRTCGNQVHGGLLKLAEGPKPEPTPRGIPQHILDRMRLQLSEVDFPVYTAVGLTPHLGGSGGGSDGVHDVKVRAGDDSLSVATSKRAFQELAAEARQALWLHADRREPPGPERSDSAILIESAVRGEQTHRDVAGAELTTLELYVEGVPTEFVAVRGQAAWAAVADVGGVRITVASRGVDPARVWLEQVDDPTQLTPAPA